MQLSCNIQKHVVAENCVGLQSQHRIHSTFLYVNIQSLREGEPPHHIFTKLGLIWFTGCHCSRRPPRPEPQQAVDR